MSVSLHPRSLDALRLKSTQMRIDVLTMAHRSHSGHIGSCFSVVDILIALYFGHLRYDPKIPEHSERDRCILSKGHACAALYAVLAEAGFLEKKELETYLCDGSRLSGHPSLGVPGIEASTGSLGHGLGIGVGIALGASIDHAPFRTVVVMSDGECDEGSNWEAIMAAAHWKLSSLAVIVDYNALQAFGRTQDVMNLEPFADKWRAFGWNVFEANGHDFPSLQNALQQSAAPSDRPSVIIAHTIKGKGVSFMESALDWHYWSPSDAHVAQAMAELSPLLSSIEQS